MTTPPEAVIKGGKWVDLDEFGVQFSAFWSRLEQRFLKFECWQRYQETEAAESQKSYVAGNFDLARELLCVEAEPDRVLYREVKKRKIDYARIRLVHLPLTDYLRYEMMAYSIRARMGENIRIARFPEEVPLPSEDYFDFLLFDRRIALVHDYGSGTVGVQAGGWLVDDPRTISLLEGKALSVLGGTVSVEKFLASGLG